MCDVIGKKEDHCYLLSGGILQDEFGPQLHFGKHDQWNSISLEQKVSEQSMVVYQR
jgi:hypothetical protein